LEEDGKKKNASHTNEGKRTNTLRRNENKRWKENINRKGFSIGGPRKNGSFGGDAGGGAKKRGKTNVYSGVR